MLTGLSIHLLWRNYKKYVLVYDILGVAFFAAYALLGASPYWIAIPYTVLCSKILLIRRGANGEATCHPRRCRVVRHPAAPLNP